MLISIKNSTLEVLGQKREPCQKSVKTYFAYAKIKCVKLHLQNLATLDEIKTERELISLFYWKNIEEEKEKSKMTIRKCVEKRNANKTIQILLYLF